MRPLVSKSRADLCHSVPVAADLVRCSDIIGAVCLRAEVVATRLLHGPPPEALA
jgi:hypothetical protein